MNSEIVCETAGCARPSCRPEGYPPMCSKHYLAMVNKLWGFKWPDMN